MWIIIDNLYIVWFIYVNYNGSYVTKRIVLLLSFEVIFDLGLSVTVRCHLLLTCWTDVVYVYSGSLG